MRTIKRTGRFKRDYQREKSGVLGKKLDALLENIIGLLIEDKPLPKNLHDHALIGTLKDCRDCHIRPDLLLIYAKGTITASNFFDLVHTANLDFNSRPLLHPHPKSHNFP